MFKVECPGCKAPYQVDERRVPSGGLKMRCPKCGTSFQVDPPSADPREALPSPVLGAALGGIDNSEAPPARPPLPKRKPAMKGTMIGVAPPRVGPGAPAPEVREAPKPRVEHDDLPMPARPGQHAPSVELDLPAARVTAPAGRPSATATRVTAPAGRPTAPARPAVPRPHAPEAATASSKNSS